MQKGNIGVTTENIFPIIKKFLYSDHEIFLRELVSNAVDATQKLNTLASIGEFKGELGDLTIHVELGKDTITISDRGIGLTAEEIEKYINQIAFSGANDFLEKYKDDIVYVKSTETGKKYPIGIKLKGNAWVEKTGWYPDTCVVGLAAGLKNKDLAVKFIEENILED